MLLADFPPYVALELPGCDDFIIQRVVREELHNLYCYNALWLYSDTPTIATTGTLSFTLPAQTMVHEIRSLRTDTRDIMPVGTGSVNSAEYDDAGKPEVVFLQNDAWVARPAPETTLTASAVLQIGPVATATEVPDAIANRHRPLWEHLVLTRLQAMAGQEWSNPKIASYHAVEATRLMYEERRRMDGWSARRAPVVRYGGI